METKKKPSIILALILSIAICWLSSVANGMPTLGSAKVDGRDGHRSDAASGNRLRRQMDYSEDETVVVDAYVGSDDEQPAADGNLTLRFGYGGYQQQYNPYGWNPYGGGQQPYPGGYQPPIQPAVPNYYNNNYPGGYPAVPYGPYNYNYPDYGSSSNTTTTINPFYNNFGYNYFYPVTNSTTTTTTTTTARPTTTTTTTRPYGNYYVFNFRDGSNSTDIDDGAYSNGGAVGQDDGFLFGNR